MNGKGYGSKQPWSDSMGFLDFPIIWCSTRYRTQSLRLALCKGPYPYLRTETDPEFETFGFLVFRIPDDGQSPGPDISECHMPSTEDSKQTSF
jgi:hypothetical protein